MKFVGYAHCCLKLLMVVFVIILYFYNYYFRIFNCQNSDFLFDRCTFVGTFYCKMPNICEYITCRKRKTNIDCIMHRFPSKIPELMNQWIINCGNPTLLYMQPEKLHNRYLCNAHFTEDSFMDPITKKRLKLSAVPIAFKEDLMAPSTSTKKSTPLVTMSTSNKYGQPLFEVQNIPQKNYSRQKPSFVKSSFIEQYQDENEELSSDDFLHQIENLPSSPKLKTKKKQSVDKEANPAYEQKRLRQSLARKKYVIKKLQEKIKLLTKSSTIDTVLKRFKFPSVHSKALVGMQFRQKQTKWSKDEKNFSLMLFYKSPTSYNFLRNQKIVLPGPSTLRRWIGKTPFKPGLCQKFFHQIKLRFEDKTEKEKSVILCFDEMSIMEFLEYSKAMDIIEGFEDLGHRGRTNNTARYALVFLVRGLYVSWKLPVSYFLSHTGVKAGILALLIKDVIQALLEAGLLVKVCVCDQGANNRGALSILEVSVDQPFFNVNGVRVFALYDVPHLFKNFKTNLQEGDFTYDGKVISFNDIIQVYNIDKKNEKCRAIPKLTDAHIYPDRLKKMKVKLAVQVLSHSVASAIKTCINTNEITSATASNTANFIDFLDKLFDGLNSKVLFCKNPYKCALSDSNTYVLDVLKQAEYIIPRLTKVDKTSAKISRPYCFSGLTQTIRGIKLLFQQEKTYGMSFILTNRLNQDVLENLFSVYRQKGGYNRNPTVRTLRTIFRMNAIHSLITPSQSSNCEADVDLLVDVPMELHETESSGSSEGSAASSPESPTEQKVPNLEDCSVSYFAGYLAARCNKEFNCGACTQYLSTDIELTDTEQLLIIHKLYDNILDTDSRGLVAPSSSFREIVDVSVRCIDKHFASYYYKNNISRILKKKGLKKIEKLDNDWLDGECKIHRHFILDKLILCKVYKKCKWFLTKKSHTMYPKLRVLQHM